MVSCHIHPATVTTCHRRATNGANARPVEEEADAGTVAPTRLEVGMRVESMKTGFGGRVWCPAKITKVESCAHIRSAAISTLLA